MSGVCMEEGPGVSKSRIRKRETESEMREEDGGVGEKSWREKTRTNNAYAERSG